MRMIKRIVRVTKHTKDDQTYYKAEIIDDKGDESSGYLIGEGDSIEVFHHDAYDQTKFIIKPPK